MTWEESTQQRNEYLKRRLAEPKPRPERVPSELEQVLARVQTRYKVLFFAILLLLAGTVAATKLGTEQPSAATPAQPPSATQAQRAS